MMTDDPKKFKKSYSQLKQKAIEKKKKKHRKRILARLCDCLFIKIDDPRSPPVAFPPQPTTKLLKLRKTAGIFMCLFECIYVCLCICDDDDEAMFG